VRQSAGVLLLSEFNVINKQPLS